MENTYIGIDVGTSGIKLVLIDENRDILSQSSREYEVSHPHEGWSEIEPSIWYEKMLEGLHELLKDQNPKLVRTIGVTGQMHTLILLDKDGNSLRPAMMWNDKRTSKYIPILREKLSKGYEGKYLSKIVSTGSPAANLYWVSREEPEIFRQCKKFLIGPDYLVYKLTGKAGTDFVEASTSSMYYIKRKEWSEDIRELIGLPIGAYPVIRGSSEIVGNVIPKLAEELNFSEDVKVIAGTGDNPATAISTGCIVYKYPVLSLGTSGVLTFPLDSVNEDTLGKIILFSADRKSFSYLIQGVVQSVGECINWWTRKILGLKDFGTFDGEIDDDVICKSSLLFYPHINGDKTIYSDPKLRGAFIGLSSDTKASEMYYALLEGLSFAVKQLYEYVEIHDYNSLKVTGGGSKSDLWLQILSNVMNMKIERLSGVSSPSFGAALLAYASDNPNEEIKINIQTTKEFTPDFNLAEIYESKYTKYLRIHDALKYISGD